MSADRLIYVTTTIALLASFTAGADTRLLVMVEIPAPHYSPGSPSSFGYLTNRANSRSGSIARALERKHELIMNRRQIEHLLTGLQAVIRIFPRDRAKGTQGLYPLDAGIGFET